MGEAIARLCASLRSALRRDESMAHRIVTDAMGETLAIGSGKEPMATAAAALEDIEHILATRMG